MMEPRVQSTWVNETCKTQLFDLAQTLKEGMLDDFEDQIIRNGDKTIDRIINDFVFVSCQIEMRFVGSCVRFTLF